MRFFNSVGNDYDQDILHFRTETPRKPFDVGVLLLLRQVFFPQLVIRSFTIRFASGFNSEKNISPLSSSSAKLGVQS